MAKRWERETKLPELFTRPQWAALAENLGLSRRQAQVARLICRALTTAEMARELSISNDTVRLHRRALFAKLRVDDRVGVPVRLVLAHLKLGDGL